MFTVLENTVFAKQYGIFYGIIFFEKLYMKIKNRLAKRFSPLTEFIGI